MCGRLSLSAATHREAAVMLAHAVPGFEIEHLAKWLERAGYEGRTNVAPGQVHWVVRGHARRPILDRGLWGLHPGDKPGKLIINARAETIEQRPLFRAAFQGRRALIPADGFFEWEKRDKQRLPHWFHRPDREALLFAAVLEPPHGHEQLPQFSIVTVPAEGEVAHIHDRMPAIIERDEVREWLFHSPARAHALLRPRADLLSEFRVSTRFNVADYEGELKPNHD